MIVVSSVVLVVDNNANCNVERLSLFNNSLNNSSST